MTNLLEVEGLTKHFPVTRGLLGRAAGQVRAVDDISFTIGRGETLGLVGESGSGKTTAGRAILRLIEPTSGRVTFDGSDVLAASSSALRALRRQMQIVFQDPYSSLNPRLRVVDLIGEALEVHGLLRGAAVETRVRELLGRVGLSPNWLNRYPHEFSGGQRQRIGIARAIALEPKLVVCDEPVSALDVSVQAQVLNLLRELGRELSLSYLFIAHDLSVVRHVSQRVAVMYLGRIVELAPAERLYAAPAHPYTRALLSAIPVPDPKRVRRRLVLTGDVPSPLDPPSGCHFHTRCPAALERCADEEPAQHEVEPGHFVKCVHAEETQGSDWRRLVNERIEQATSERVARAGAKNAEETAHAGVEHAPAPPANTADRDEAPSEGGRGEAPPGVGGDAAQSATGGAPGSTTDDTSAVTPGEASARDSTRTAPENTRGGAARQRRREMAFATLVITILAAWGYRVRSRELSAERDLAGLHGEIAAYQRTTGRLPHTLADLGWRLPPYMHGGALADPWGRPWVYHPKVLPEPAAAQISPHPARRFALKSLGPDGVASDDDIDYLGKHRRP